jgi:hypothetical protein
MTGNCHEGGGAFASASWTYACPSQFGGSASISLATTWSYCVQDGNEEHHYWTVYFLVEQHHYGEAYGHWEGSHVAWTAWTTYQSPSATIDGVSISLPATAEAVSVIGVCGGCRTDGYENFQYPGSPSACAAEALESGQYHTEPRLCIANPAAPVDRCEQGVPYGSLTEDSSPISMALSGGPPQPVVASFTVDSIVPAEGGNLWYVNASASTGPASLAYAWANYQPANILGCGRGGCPPTTGVAAALLLRIGSLCAEGWPCYSIGLTVVSNGSGGTDKAYY